MRKVIHKNMYSEAGKVYILVFLLVHALRENIMQIWLQAWNLV